MLSIAATIGKPIILGIEACIHDGFAYFADLDSDRASTQFLYYFFQHKEPELSGQGQPGTQRNINTSIVDGLPICLPPLCEQKKIAAILSTVDEAIELSQAIVDQLCVVKKATMAELLTRGLPGRHNRFKRTAVGDVPESWTMRSIGEVASVWNGKAAGTGGTWLRVFKTKHVYDGMLSMDKSEFARDDSAARVHADNYLRQGDVLTPNMAHGTIGRVAFADHVEPRWTVDGQVMVLRANGTDLVGRYLFEWLSLPSSRQRLIELEKGGAFDTKRGQTHIYPRDVRAFVTAVPPLEEQHLIAACASSFDEPILNNRAMIRAQKQLKAGLMSLLLSGEVRVTPDEDAT